MENEEQKSEIKKTKKQTENYKSRDCFGTGGCLKYDCDFINTSVCENCIKFSFYIIKEERMKEIKNTGNGQSKIGKKMKLNKPKFVKSPACDWCCGELKPFDLIFEVESDFVNITDWICLKCVKNQGNKITKEREKKLIDKQTKLQIDYYVKELKRLKDMV